MPQIASVNVNVTSNAEQVLPAQVAKGMAKAQQGLKPLKIDTDLNTQKLNQASLALGKISGNAKEITKSIEAATARTTTFALTAGALVAVERTFSALVKSTIEVEHQLAKIKIIAGGTTQTFNEFSKGIFDVARQTSESFNNASTAALEFARAGNSLEESLKRTKAALSLVKISGVDVSTAIQTITTTLNTFGSEVSDVNSLVDKLSNVDSKFSVSAGALADALSAVGNSAAENNVQLNDLLGAITAISARTGQSGQVIGNAFKSIFTRIGRSENVELLNELGVATEDVAGKSRNSIEVLRDLSKVYIQLGDSQRKQVAEQIAGVFQIGRFQALMRDLSSSFSITSEASKAAADSFGSTNARLEELNKTTASLLQQSGTNLTQFAASFGKLTFESPLKNLLSSFTADGSILQGVNDLLGRIADNDRSKSIGETFAKGFIEGLSNFISGPGFIIVATVLLKAFGTAFKFVGESLKSLLGINKALTDQAVLQQQINQALSLASKEDLARITNAKTLNTQLALTVDLIRKQATAIGANAALAANAYQRKVRPGPGGDEGTPDIRRFRASGYIPVREEMAAVQSSPDYSGNRNARPQLLKNFSIGGVPQNVVINSAEKVVPTKAIYGGYAGPDQYSILNPKQQKMFGFNMGYYPKKIPNLAELIKLSSGLIIDPKKQYVFRSAEITPGMFGDITKKERTLSSGAGFETITQADLAELSKKRAGQIPLIKVIDPSRVLQRDFLNDSKYSKLKSKIFVTQSNSLGVDKFGETQIGGGFGRSISLDKFSFKNKEETLKSLNAIESQLGKDYFIKDKKGYGNQGGLYTGEYLKSWISFIAEKGTEAAANEDGGRDALKVIKRFFSSPSRYFVQKKLPNAEREFRVTLVGTQGGSIPVGISPRGKLNSSGTSYGFSDPEGKAEKISQLIGNDAARNILKIAQESFNKVPDKQRIATVVGMDVTHGGPVEFNSSDRVGYSGSLDNPETRGKTARGLAGVTEQTVKSKTQEALDILNYQGPDDLRKFRFKQYTKSLNDLKKNDEIAFFKIAANLARSGFGIKAGGRKKVLFGDDASNYFSLRGFAGGYTPGVQAAIGRESQSVDSSRIYVANVNTPKYSGPVVANTRDEPTGSSLLNAVNTRLSEGYVPNLAANPPRFPGQRTTVVDEAVIARQQSILDETVNKYTAQLNKEINKTGGMFTILFGGTPEEVVKKIAEKQKTSVGLRNNALFNKPAFERASNNVLQNVIGRRDTIVGRGSIAAAFGLPLASGLVDAFAGQTRGGRTVSGALQGAGVGATLGSFLGPAGLTVGTLAGLGIGAGTSLIGEGSFKAQEEAKKRQDALDKRKSSIDSAGSLISLESQREDLRRQGASGSILRAQDAKIRDTRLNVDRDLLKKFAEISKALPNNLEEQTNRKIEEVTKAETERSRQQRLSDARTVRDQANQPGLRDVARTGFSFTGGTSPLLLPIFDKIFKEGSSQFNKNQRQIVGEGVIASADFSKLSTGEIGKLRNAIEALPGTGFGPSGLSKGQQESTIQTILNALPENQRGAAREQLEGIKPGDFKAILLPEFNRLVEASKKDEEDRKNELVIFNQVLREIAESSNQRRLGQFGAAQGRESLAFDKANTLNTNSPFLSELTKALESNSLELQKQTNETESSRDKNFGDFVDSVTKALPRDQLGKLADEIDKLQQSTPSNLDDNLSSLIKKLDDIGGTEGSASKEAIGALRSDFNANNAILDATLAETKRQNALTAESLKKLDKISTGVSSFGGLRGLLQGNRIPGGVGTDLNSTANLRRTIRDLPSAGIIGGEERERQRRTAETAAGQAQLRAADKLKSAGFGDDLIKQLVDVSSIQKANQNSQEKELFGVASEFVRSSPFFEQIKQQKPFENVEKEAIKRNDLGFILDQVKGVRTNLPQNKQDQDELIRKLTVLVDAFRKVGETSRLQVKEQFKIVEPEITPRQEITTPTRANILTQQGQPQVNLNTAFTGLQNTNTALTASLTNLTTIIQGLDENIAKLITSNAGDQVNATSPFANINITAVGGDSDKTQQLVNKISEGLNSLNFKINQVIKQTKSVIPPSRDNPFSNINNSQVSLE